MVDLNVAAGILGGIADVGAGISGAITSSAQARIESRNLKFRAKQAEISAKDSINRGMILKRRILRESQVRAGAQRERISARGIDVGVGSARHAIMSILSEGDLDAFTVELNAAREALGFKLQALTDRSRAKIATIAGRAEAFGSLATGGLSAVRSITGGVLRAKEDKLKRDILKKRAEDIG